MNNDIIKPSRTFIFLFMVPLVILMITLIAYFKVNQGKAFIGTIMLGILVACIRAKWMLRKHVEFWVAIAMILLVFDGQLMARSSKRLSSFHVIFSFEES